MLVIAGWAIWSRTEVASASAQLDASIERARKAGIPTTPPELEAKLEIPENENAASIYVRAIGRFKGAHPAAWKEMSKLLMDLRYDSPAGWNRFAQIVKLAEPELRDIERGSRRRFANYRRKWQQGPGVLFPEYASLKEDAKILGMRALLLSRQGQPLKALDDIDTVRRLAMHAGQDPVLISVLVQLALDSIYLERMQTVVNSHPTPEVVARAREILDETPIPGFRRAIAGELVMTRVCFAMLARGPATSLGFSEHEPAELRLARFTTYRRAFEANSVDVLTRLHQELPEDSNNALATDAALKRADRVLAEDTTIMKASAALLPVFGQTGDAVLGLAARKAVGEAALKLLANHKAGTAFPEELPFATVDPFSGKPLLYRRTKTGFIVYSVDRNRKDDKGILSGEVERSSDTDLGWRYPEGRRPRKVSSALP